MDTWPESARPSHAGRIRRARAMLVAVAAFGIVTFPACSWFEIKQREWIFRVASASWQTPPAAPPGYDEVWIPVGSQDERINAWWGKASSDTHPARAPAVLFLHGARRDLNGHANRIAGLQKLGFNVLAIDYRGFGKSSGTLPSEDMTYEDALAAWEWLKRREPDSRNRFIYGYSLGGAIAAELATRSGEAQALILESTFTSIRDMAERTAARYLPLSLLLTQRYDTLGKLPKLSIPLVIVHGTEDKVVPLEMARRLFDAAPEPKRLVIVEGASHYSAAARAADELRRELSSLMCAGRTRSGRFC